MKVAFITNICSHYRVKTFETLASALPVDYYFYSAGDEWYWQQKHGINSGRFSYKYLRGFKVGHTRITPSLALDLFKGNYDVYIKCINGKFALPITYLIARLKRKPFILWTGIWKRLETPIHRLLFPFTRYIYTHADAIVVYGEHVKRYLVNEGVKPEKIFIANQAVDNDLYCRTIAETEKDQLRKSLNISPNQNVVLYLGRLEEGKGLEYLVKAFAIADLPNTVLLIAGDGSLRGNLEADIRERKLSQRVRFAGYVRYQGTVCYYSIAYIYVLPSITTELIKETWGLVVNEAFNQGVPVIATEAVGAAAGGLVQDGINGLIVPERNSQALADAILSLLNDPLRRHSMSENARRVIASWDNENMVKGFEQAIKYVTNKLY